jgi:hypothetical protein
MEMSRRLINLIGAAVVTLIILGGLMLVELPLFGAARDAVDQAKAATYSNNVIRDRLTELYKQNANAEQLRKELSDLRAQIAAADELMDASALASTAAKSSGARIVAVTFGERQVFAAPVGGGIGEDGKPSKPQPTAAADTPQVQTQVTFEAEVSSPAQAAAFLDGLRSGPRLLQVVQSTCSPTNDAKRFTVTVDALIFSVRS